MASKKAIIIWAAILCVALTFLYFVRAVLFPFAIAVFIAALLDPLVKNLQVKRKISRIVSILMVYFCFLLSVIMLILWLWQPVVEQTTQLTRTAPQALQNSETSVREMMLKRSSVLQRYKIKVPDTNADVATSPTVSVIDDIPMRWETDEEAVDRLMSKSIDAVSDKVQELAPKILGDVMTTSAGILSQLINIILIPILVFFLLKDADYLKKKASYLLPAGIRVDTVDVIDDIGHVFMNYIRGYVLSAAIFTTVFTVLFTILGVPNAIILGLLAGLMYFVPYIGFPIVMIMLGASSALGPAPHILFFFFPVQSVMVYIVWVLVISFVLYIIYDQTVTPRVVGGAVGLHPAFAVFAIMSGATLFGIWGMMLAFPVAGSIKVVFERLMPIMKIGEDIPVTQKINEKAEKPIENK